MRLGVMARQFKEQLDDPQFASMSFADRFTILADAEWSARKSNHLKSLIKNAGYAIPGANIEDIEYLPDQKLDKSQILRCLHSGSSQCHPVGGNWRRQDLSGLFAGHGCKPKLL